MNPQENIGSFLKENKDILKEYLETRFEIMRLSGIRSVSQAIGLAGWILAAALLLLLISIFGGLTLGFWFSALLKSNALGFGITTLLLVLILVLCTAFRKQLFINPLVRAIIRQAHKHND